MKKEYLEILQRQMQEDMAKIVSLYNTPEKIYYIHFTAHNIKLSVKLVEI